MFYINYHLAWRRLAVTITTFLLLFCSKLIVQSAVAESDSFHLEGGDTLERPDGYIKSSDGRLVYYGHIIADTNGRWS